MARIDSAHKRRNGWVSGDARLSCVRRTVNALCVLTVWLTGCDAPASEVPRGDELDRLLNFPTGADLRLAALRTCVGERLTDLSEFEGFVRQSELRSGEPAIERVGNTPAESSGLVERAIGLASKSDDPNERNSEANGELPVTAVSPELDQVLNGELVIDGVLYAGCNGFAEQARASDEIELLRLRLADDYSAEVGQLLDADAGVAEVNADWSACMAGRGYPDLARPGDQIRLIMDGLQSAGNDYSELQRLLEFDRAVTRSTQECASTVDFLTRRGQARRALEDDYVQRHRSELETLILALAEPS
jgi:hypothetical protein